MPASCLRLRAAKSGDFDTVYELFAEVQAIHAEAEPEFFKPPAKDTMFRDFFENVLKDPNRHLVLAFLEEAPAGYVLFFTGSQPANIYQAERCFAYIHQLVVTRDLRRTGCASTLIQHVKGEATKQGIELLGIDFWSFNNAARGCFERNGFEVNQEFMWTRL